MASRLVIHDDSAFPAPNEVYNWKIYILAICASMGSAMFGYDSGFIGGAITLPSFVSRFGLGTSSSEQSAALSANIISTFQAGCFFGAIFMSFLAEKYGRKFPLIACGVVFNVGTIVQVASTGSLGMIYAGRALTGLGVGAATLVVPQYISECSPPAIRGRLVGIFETSVQFSQIIGFWINYGVNENISSTSDTQWRIPFALQLAPGTLLIVLMLLQPESPRWLIKTGDTDKAIRVLGQIRCLTQDDGYIAWEVGAIKQQLHDESELGATRPLGAKLKEILQRGNRIRLILGMSIMMLQNLSGINALNYYSPKIFKSIGFSGTSVGLLATGVFGIVKAMTTLIFMCFGIDTLGRRKPLLIGSIGAIIAMFYLGAYSKVSGSFQHTVVQDGGAYVAIVMIYIFAVFYALSWNGIPWVFCAEIFPTGIRSLCLLFTTCTQWLGQFIIVYSTPYMMTNITYGTFFFFGSFLVVGALVIFFFMPETKGLSLEEMSVLFNVKGLAITQRKKADEIIASQRVAENVADLKDETEYSNVEGV
ncbi:general substrate transporter [Annulohypoxylon maeteangense]|uniref:general substrate transporter n=1 Tax=Annulohypoxylon maeteangense TaxID=1927788 RepID=UPI0020080F24|nr:general substrate transporter [Annulohypoxylon maeteangense]KAI0880240.1 general substrate transporter [Annulohypoxylon maeteangense]